MQTYKVVFIPTQYCLGDPQINVKVEAEDVFSAYFTVIENPETMEKVDRLAYEIGLEVFASLDETLDANDISIDETLNEIRNFAKSLLAKGS